MRLRLERTALTSGEWQNENTAAVCLPPYAVCKAAGKRICGVLP